MASGDVPLSEHVREIVVNDFNGDGILDFFLADTGWDTPPFPGFKNSLLLGNGTGFDNVTDRLPDIEDFTHSASSGDIDGDGDVDIPVANLNPTAEKISYFLINDGSANFTLDRLRLPDNFVDPASNGYQTSKAELADLDADGFPDLIIGQEFKTSPNVAPSRIYWNDGSGNFSEESPYVVKPSWTKLALI